MKMRFPAFLLLLTVATSGTVFLVGCPTRKQTPVSVATPDAQAQAYADANKAIMTDFGATLKQISARPIPKPPKTATKRERRELYAKELDVFTVSAQDALTRRSALASFSRIGRVFKRFVLEDAADSRENSTG